MRSFDLTGRFRLVLLVVLVAVLPACAIATDPPDAEVMDTTEAAGGCDDRMTPTPEPPPAALSDGLSEGVGSGDIWFYAGDGRWGDRVIRKGPGFQGKFPMWVGQNGLPTVSVVSAAGDLPEGTVGMNETTDGLPGPLPAGVRFPSRGCWTVTATLGEDTAEITVYIP